MGIHGLSTFIARTPDNFTPFELHNTHVVVDACNLVYYLYRQSSLVIHYGGEYMDFTVGIRIFLRRLHKCRITPIFVFDGCHSSEGAKRNTLIKRNRERIRSLASFIQISQHADADKMQSLPDILPQGIHKTLMEVLHEYNMPYLTCEREADTHVAELAIYLDCPVLSNDSDFYLFQSDSPKPAYRIIPLVSLDSQPKRLPQVCQQCSTESRGQCFALACSLFRPSRSTLNVISPPLVPLLAVLVGNDVFTDCRFPATLKTIVQSMNAQGMSNNLRRIHSIVQWLSKFDRDVHSCVRELLGSYEPVELDTILKQMIHCVLGYLVYPGQNGPELNAMLPVGAQIKPVASGVERLKPTLRPPVLTRTTNALDQSVNTLCSALSSKMPVNSSVPTEFRSRWPWYLFDCFHSGRISTSLLDAVYVRGGAVMRIFFENLNFERSIYAVTESIRSVAYSLLLEIESASGGTQQMCGLQNGKPVENRRHASDMQQFSVVLPSKSSKILQAAKLSMPAFLLDHLQVHSFSCDLPHSKELTVLYYVLTIWYRNSLYKFRSVGLALRTLSTGLAFLACALVTFEHCRDLLGERNALQYAVAELCEHYARLSNSAKQTVGTQISSFIPFSVSLTHQLNELQLVCMDFKCLVDLFDCRLLDLTTQPLTRLPPSSDHLRFLPGWVLFPSNRLLYWMAQDVELVPATHRVGHITDTWIPLLLAIFSHDQPELVRRITEQFLFVLSAAESQVK